jgi:undecaprenyl-diphosphatase
VVEAIVWGIIQGLTEFFPISSSGHLVLVPALLAKAGVEIEIPDLATSAVLHLGTLLAVVGYYRRDLWRLVRFRSDEEARLVLWLLVIGSLPAAAGLVVERWVEGIQQTPRLVSGFLIFTAAVLFLSTRITLGEKRLEQARPIDALIVGFGQLLAVVPGVSRSGMTIVAGELRGLAPREAARYSFLLGVPAIAAAGLYESWRVGGLSGIEPELWVGLAAAAISGYAAIAFLLRWLARGRLLPFALYCLAAGILSLLVL